MTTKTFFATIATLALTSAPALAEVNSKTHQLCSQAKDYVGCVRAMTGTVTTVDANDPLVSLRAAMKQVANRLEAGTSLRDSMSTFQPVTDAHALVPAAQQDTLAYQSATLAINLWNRTRKNWADRIEYTNYGERTGTPYLFAVVCENFDIQVAAFNKATGKKAIDYRWDKSGLMIKYCDHKTVKPETLMYQYTIGVLREGATDPQTIANYVAKREEAIRLAALGPWQRHLEKNPDLKTWAEANPEAAVREQAKFNKKNGSDPVVLPTLPDSMPYLQGTVVEKYLGA